MDKRREQDKIEKEPQGVSFIEFFYRLECPFLEVLLYTHCECTECAFLKHSIF